MSPSPTSSGMSAGAAPLPPLPDLQGAGAAGAGGQQQGGGFMAALMAGVGPVKQAVDAINAACQQIVQSGVVPGSEQLCSQIVGMANQLTAMAVQQMTSPGQGQQGAPGGGIAPPPPGGAPLAPPNGAVTPALRS